MAEIAVDIKEVNSVSRNSEDEQRDVKMLESNSNEIKVEEKKPQKRVIFDDSRSIIEKIISKSNSKYEEKKECKRKNVYGISYSDPDVWTNELEMIFLEYITLYTDSSVKCKKASITHKKYSLITRVLLFLSGMFLFVVPLTSLDENAKNIIITICGIISALCVTVQERMDFQEQYTLEGSAALQLERITRNIRLEITKPVNNRVEPVEYIGYLEGERTRILTDVGIEMD